MNAQKYLMCIITALITVWPVTSLAQTAVKMQLPLQSKEPLNVKSLLDVPLQVGTISVLSDFNFGISGGNPPYVFSWLKDNQIIAIGNTTEITPISGSSYALKVSDKSNCNTKVAIDFLPTTKENNHALTHDITITPTVVKNHIKIGFSANSPALVTYRIINLQGIVRQSEKFSGNAVIPVNLPDGIYIVQIERELLSVSKKIIVIH